jgi:hypothetical protein
MTGLAVAARFRNHKRGRKGNVFVLKHGTGLLPELFAHLNPMPYEAAMTMERELAEELRGTIAKQTSLSAAPLERVE